jgi:uncharacterized protein (DUF1800 family)
MDQHKSIFEVKASKTLLNKVQLFGPWHPALKQTISASFSLACGFTLIMMLAACSGGSVTANGESPTPVIQATEGLKGVAASTAGMTVTALATEKQASLEDASRLLTQATFGITSQAEIQTVKQAGIDAWLAHQFNLAAPIHLDYLKQQAPRTSNSKPIDEMAYEALWQQWLYSPAQLRARVSFALSQIFVISNVAPDLNATAMAAYMDMLNRNAFGNYRQLLEDVALHPAMGYYLNMMESEKENPDKGTHPNENFAREVLQLFSIGLAQLNPDGSIKKDADGKTLPTYDETVVKGFAKAFSGWSFGGRDTAKTDAFHHGDENWVVPMQAWASKHSTAPKQLLNGTILSAGQTPQQDMSAALDNIFNHPNVGPFISRRLIQRLVTSNPTPAYIGRVAAVFNNNGAGVRGDLKEVVRTILTDVEARDLTASATPSYGKQREPVIRFANMLRALNAKAVSGHNAIHYLDSADNALGQSPLLSPSVFNFFSPDFKAPGAIATAGLSAPEFQITTETTVVGTLNFFARLIKDGAYKTWNSKDSELTLELGLFDDVAGDANALVDRINLLFMNGRIAPTTRTAMLRAINSIDVKSKSDRIKSALVLTAISPEFVIQQ